MCVCCQSFVTTEVDSVAVEEVTTSDETVEHDVMNHIVDDTSLLYVPVSVVPSALAKNTHIRVTPTVPNVTLTVSNTTAAVPQVPGHFVHSSRTAEDSVSSSSMTVTSSSLHGILIFQTSTALDASQLLLLRVRS